jgi:aryl-alcohol dehydrogenase-like predicted oxidoreductase
MEHRPLGRTGVMVSPLGLGTANFGESTDEETSMRIIDRALDAGINLIDTANSYGRTLSETIIGKALKQNGRRDQVVLATKFHNPVGPGPNDRGTTRRHILTACDDSLRRLQTDRIDLYQIHRPVFSVPHDETLSALNDLVRQGKVLYIGTSAFPAWMIMEGLAISEKYGWARYVTEQPPYNLLDRRSENEVVPLCLRYGVGILPFSSLGGGVLAGRYRPGVAPPADSRLAHPNRVFLERASLRAIAAGEQVAALARERGLATGQFALLWCKDQPGVVAPLIGPRTVAHLEELLPVLDMRLLDEDRQALDAINPPGTAVSDFHNTSGWMKMHIPLD